MIRSVLVVVPAADEEQRIGACLDAVHLSTQQLEDDVAVLIVVALDACADRTAQIVAARPFARAVTTAARSVGVARATGTAFGLSETGAAFDQTWTAHTDADSEVPPHWLTHQLDAARAGAELVLGTVVPSLELPHPTRRAWQALHPTVDGHPHIHGANLGIRADVLIELGGWSARPTGEDVDLVTRAVAARCQISRTDAAPVWTSARTDGRAPHGFASYLQALAGLPPEHPTGHDTASAASYARP